MSAAEASGRAACSIKRAPAEEQETSVFPGSSQKSKGS